MEYHSQVTEADLVRAIDDAYAQLDFDEREAIDKLAEHVSDKRRGCGKFGGRQIIAKVGRLLLKQPCLVNICDKHGMELVPDNHEGYLNGLRIAARVWGGL